MRPALRALLTEIIDYAGLFPPASLELAPALRNFAAYRQSPDAWMLARFICPVAKLSEALGHRAELASGSSIPRFSVLGRAAENVVNAPAMLREDFQAISAFERDADGAIVADAFEVRLPADAAGDATSLQAWTDALQGAAADAAREQTMCFTEAPLTADWRRSLPALVETLHTANEGRPQGAPPAGLKLRTGGTTAAAFPAPEQVALAIERCRDAGVPLKFTAGLHHPLRYYDPGLRTMSHGFLNVFLAAALAHSAALDLHDIQAVLEEQDVRHLTLDDEVLGWNDAEAALDEIEHARRYLSMSFGSCSFDEPREDLRRLGYLP